MKALKASDVAAAGVSRDRRTFLGGTDAAAVLGLSRYRTPLQVWAEKTGVLEPEDIDHKLHVKLGKRLEEVVAELYTEKTGKKVRRVNETLYHPEFPFLGANIDRRVVGEDTVLECKTASSWKGKEFEGEELPPEHILQVVHYLAVTGASKAELAVLIGNHDFMIRTIERDEPMISKLVGREVAFWREFVIPRVMPTLVTKYDDPTLQRLFPNATQPTLALDDRANQLAETIQAMQQDSKSLDGQIEQMKNEMKQILGDHECGTSARWQVSWKSQASTRIDAKALREQYPDVAKAVEKETSSRVLRIKSLQEEI